MRVLVLFGKIVISFCAVCLSLIITHTTSIPVGSLSRGTSVVGEHSFYVSNAKADDEPDINEVPDVDIEYETVTEDIPFDTVYVSDPTLVYKTEKVMSEGVTGQISYTYEVVRSGGVVISKTLIEQKTVCEVQDKIVHVGDDPTAPYGEMIVPTQGKLTSYYGYRPNVGASNYHYGIDIAWKRGTPVVAADGGVVTVVKKINSFGLYICIDHGGELETLYAHLDSATVAVGERVARGQLIGYMGDSGNATAPCLHFEVRLDGKRINPLSGYIDKSDIVTPST